MLRKHEVLLFLVQMGYAICFRSYRCLFAPQKVFLNVKTQVYQAKYRSLTVLHCKYDRPTSSAFVSFGFQFCFENLPEGVRISCVY